MTRRRTSVEIAAAARAEEREACIEHLRDKIAEVEAFAKRGRITTDEARQLVHRLDAVADGLAAGLHR